MVDSPLSVPQLAPAPGPSPSGPVAVFDSGVGGLSVLRHIRAILPHEDLIYLADQAHVPYGSRSTAEITEFSFAITDFLLEHGTKTVVVACNTATAAALTTLRERYAHFPFVGMEPAVKPGARQTETGRVGVLATAGTFESQRYARLMARFARDVTLYESPCAGLVPLIEQGLVSASQTEALLKDCLDPMLAAGVDTIVLGCTHYPFVLPLIEALVGSEVAVIDPAPAVARQTERVLERTALATTHRTPGRIQAYSSGDPAAFARQVEQLLGWSLPVSGLHWRGGQLISN